MPDSEQCRDETHPFHDVVDPGQVCLNLQTADGDVSRSALFRKDAGKINRWRRYHLGIAFGDRQALGLEDSEFFHQDVE